MENPNCNHICSGNCRRVGCNCECGEFHLNEEVIAELTHDKRLEEAEQMQRDDNEEALKIYNQE